MTHLRRLALIALATAAVGCSGLVARTTDQLAQAVLEHDDPATVRDGAPAYLLLMDAMVNGAPDDAARLGSAAQLYAAYAALFVDEPERQARLAERAFGYATRAACAADEALCALVGLDHDGFRALVDGYGEDPEDAAPLLGLAQAWLLRIRARPGDWDAIAELPKPQALLERVVALDPAAAQAHLYLGVLETLRPPALGGRPEQGRQRFERAIELSGGHDLGAKVQFAESYARLVFDRELHDRLLNEVLAAPTAAPRLTLQNTFAKQRARALLQSADSYF